MDVIRYKQWDTSLTPLGLAPSGGGGGRFWRGNVAGRKVVVTGTQTTRYSQSTGVAWAYTLVEVSLAADQGLVWAIEEDAGEGKTKIPFPEIAPIQMWAYDAQSGYDLKQRPGVSAVIQRVLSTSNKEKRNALSITPKHLTLRLVPPPEDGRFVAQTIQDMLWLASLIEQLPPPIHSAGVMENENRAKGKKGLIVGCVLVSGVFFFMAFGIVLGLLKSL
jgi:hypothetical protein